MHGKVWAIVYKHMSNTWKKIVGSLADFVANKENTVIYYCYTNVYILYNIPSFVIINWILHSNTLLKPVFDFVKHFTGRCKFDIFCFILKHFKSLWPTHV